MQKKSKSKERKVERNIEARSDGYSFRVRMKLGNTYINETFFSLDEARAYRDLLRAGKATDVVQEKVLRAKAEKKKATGTTIGGLFDMYLTEITPAKKGAKEEEYAIRRLQRFKDFANLPVYLADGDTIERLKRDLRADNLSNTTVRKYLMIVSSLFRVAITRRWCVGLQNPVKTVELPRPAKMRSRRFELDEWKYFRAELVKAQNPLILRFVEFLVETACRRGEVLRLCVKDIDLVARTAILHDTKNGEDRIIGLSSRAVEILESLLVVPSGGNVVPLRGKSTQRKVFQITESGLRFAFATAKEHAKSAYLSDCKMEGCEPRRDFLEDIRLHDCRREAVSRMFEKGLDVMEVSSMSGHRTLSMLRGYTALRASNLAKKLDRAS
ncbi:site-specific integrase [Undibacterium jejuense]|uniref:Site-specific integrase n=1 Tax=Undibacterium jejuense TaxID=1344949 RepID=A0A923HK36_9BURK|nr:site-specific integrase [Undibacterium jejuense]MBC3863192.1 site-specific integrase [Undibacterium jejuense]